MNPDFSGRTSRGPRYLKATLFSRHRPAAWSFIYFFLLFSVQKAEAAALVAFIFRTRRRDEKGKKLVASPWDSRALMVPLPKGDLTQLRSIGEDNPAGSF